MCCNARSSPAARSILLRCYSESRLNFLRHNAEVRQYARPECRADRNIRRIAPIGNWHAAYTRDVVTGIERVPPAAEVRLNQPEDALHRQHPHRQGVDGDQRERS